jgi:hypothetical protein
MSLPFDVVIPFGPKDDDIIQRCVNSVLLNVVGVRYVFVIAYEGNTRDLSNCIILNETSFPFKRADVVARTSEERAGWYIQQLIKLYAPLLISNITENILAVDADTVFYKRTRFIDNGKFLFDKVVCMPHAPYFEHMKRLHPSFTQWKPKTSGITNLMIFNRKILVEMMAKVEDLHKNDFWEVFLNTIAEKKGSGASEYEIYFNYMMNFKSEVARVRPLQWNNDGQRAVLDTQRGDWNYVSYPWYIQKKKAMY